MRRGWLGPGWDEAVVGAAGFVGQHPLQLLGVHSRIKSSIW